MEETVSWLLNMVAILLTTVVFPVLSIILIGWAREKYGVEKLRRISDELENKESLAYRAVQLAFDMIRGPGKGEERLLFAIAWLEDQLSKKGINFNEGELEGFIRTMYVEFIMDFYENWQEMLKEDGVILDESELTVLLNKLPRAG